MNYLSLFSGIGGFELGIGEKGNCVGYSEIDKYAIEVYQHHFPNHKNYGDITNISEKELPDFDLLVGGFPCQAFSIAGKRRGFNDTRGTLFFDIVRILKAKRPRLLLLENVKGLISHDKGNTLNTIVSALDELGYDIGWQVLNSKDHGVPQNRERIYFIGHLRGTPRPEVFPYRKAVKEDAGGFQQAEKIKRKIKQFNNSSHSSKRVFSTKGICATLTTMQQPYIKVSNDEKDFNVRRLTPIECERLQGFPDNWTNRVSNTQRYKQCGNAVTVNVVRDIVARLIQ